MWKDPYESFATCLCVLGSERMSLATLESDVLGEEQAAEIAIIAASKSFITSSSSTYLTSTIAYFSDVSFDPCNRLAYSIGS